MEIYIKTKYEHTNKFYLDKHEKCPICLNEIYENVDNDKEFNYVMDLDLAMNFEYKSIILSKCIDHFFHVDCIFEMLGDKDFLRCPICMTIYGIFKGNQPDGTMTAKVSKSLKCSSYENFETIVIEYFISDTPISTGTYRNAYLPYNNEGLKVLGLLKIAFDRKLIFTIGTSLTTGIEDSTIWNGIHHKTCPSGGQIFNLNCRSV